MSVIATALKHLIAAGVSGDDLVRAVAEMEAALVPCAPTTPALTARQARNARHYEARKERLKSSESRLNASETSEQDAVPLPLPSSPQTPQQPTPTPGERLPARKGPTQTEIARGFLAFWAAYPKRAGKDAAGKAFTKAMARIGGEDPLATIMAGIERALPGWDDPQFIPHPATWLNQGRWEDDAPVIRTEQRHERRDQSFQRQSPAREGRLGRMLAGAERAVGT